jgi:hypothetical protein
VNKHLIHIYQYMNSHGYILILHVKKLVLKVYIHEEETFLFIFRFPKKYIHILTVWTSVSLG